MRYRAGPHIRWLDHGTCVILLCLNSGKFLGLDSSARAIWNSLVTGCNKVEAAERLCRDFAIESASALKEVELFIQNCQNQSLIEISELSSTNRYPSPIDQRSCCFVQLSFFRAIASLITTRTLLRFGGFAKAYWSTAAVSKRFGIESNTTNKSIAQALQVFLRAEGLLPSSKAANDCLFRSLALFRFLRMIGAPVVHHIGIIEHPFESHAWVTFENNALLNDPIKIEQYKRLANLPFEQR